MAWQGASELKPVWCAAEDVPTGSPTAGGVTCTEAPPGGEMQVAALNSPLAGLHPQAAGVSIGSEQTGPITLPAGLHYTKFTNQDALGKFLVQHYDIRNPRELTSCEVCHR